jgi:hypothetical protein
MLARHAECSGVRMARRAAGFLGWVLCLSLVVACGGVTGTNPEPDATGGASSTGGASGGRPSTGGRPSSSGGAGASTGGAIPALPDCSEPVVYQAPCSTPAAHCGGPCSNSWQAHNVCTNGTWNVVEVVRCGPNASEAPQCKNSFSEGQLSPCCAADKLDCAGKPDGYPGFGCTPGEGSFCSCTCYDGQPMCGC